MTNTFPGLSELQQSVTDLKNSVSELQPSVPGMYYSVASYGAKPDAKPAQGTYQGFLMEAGGNHAYSFQAGFLPTDVGKSVVLINNSGAWPPFTGSGLNNVATIIAVTSPDDILLSRSTVNAVSGYIIWGTDNVPAFNAAVAAVASSATHAGTITGPPGQYLLASAPYSNSDGTAYDDGTPGSGLPGPVMCWSGTGFNTPCTNLPPWLPTEIPIQVQIVPGVSWFFPPGVSLIGTWDGVTVDPVVQGQPQVQPVMFGGTKPTVAGVEGGLAYCNFDGLSLSNGFVGLWNPYNTNMAEIRNCKFNTAIGMLTWGMDLGSSVKNLQFGGYAAWVNGGQWAHCCDYPLGEGGECDILGIDTLIVEPTSYNATAAAIDQWFDLVFWRSDFTADSPDFWEPQVSPLPPQQRQTGQPNGGIFPQMANGVPYAGICGSALVIISRDSRNTGPTRISNIVLKYGYRPIIYGLPGAGSEIFDVSCEDGTALANDPYNSGVQKGAIVFASATGAEIKNVGWSGSQVRQTLWDLTGARSAGVAGQPQWVTWRNCSSNNTVNTQPAYSGVTTQAGSTTPLTQALFGIVTR